MYSTWILVGLCVLAFVFQQTIPGFTDSFVLVSSDVLTRPWILVTGFFLHGDIVHLLYNMLGLALFGMILEHIIGKKLFLLVFFGAGILANVGGMFLYSRALGASGALFGVLGTLAVLRPTMRVFVHYFPLPMSMAVVVWMLGDLFGLFFPTGVGNLAHLVGLFAGLGYGFYLHREFGVKRRPRGERVEIDEKEMEEWEERWMK